MNEHEIERIAAAIHEARPDWPAASLRTLIGSKMANKPRRDVFVALAWVASESDTKTPARVLEAGPWWQAVGGFSVSGDRRTVSPDEQCSFCGHAKPVCDRLAADDHRFQPVSKGVGSKATPEAIAAAKEAARAAIEASLPPRETSWMERRPDGKCGDNCTRGDGHTGPHVPPESNDDENDGEAA